MDILQAYSREILIVLMLWVLPWKGVSMWRAARNGHKKWFIALLLINSLAILDILYIYFFSKKGNLDVMKEK